MTLENILTFFPLWSIYAVTTAAIFVSFEMGFWLGKHRFRRSEHEKNAPVGPMVGATLGLLAFMLTFTFGSANARFEARKQSVQEDANAIRSAYTLSGLLPKECRVPIHKLLREYVDIRLDGIHSVTKAIYAQVHSEEIHDRLWEEVAACQAKAEGTDAFSAFLSSLDRLADTHARRVAIVARGNIPFIIWAVLYGILILSISAMGYHAGLTGIRGSFAFFVLILSFSVVMALIVDLDRPRQGLFKVSQQSLIDLQQKMISSEAK